MTDKSRWDEALDSMQAALDGGFHLSVTGSPRDQGPRVCGTCGSDLVDGECPEEPPK